MSCVDYPSDNLLEVYTSDEVKETLSQDKNITLFDYSTIKKPYEYWYCTACHRVHKVSNATNRCVLRYKPIGALENSAGLIGAPPNWKDVYVIKETEFYDATEPCMELTLADYLPHIKRIVRISPDEQEAIVYDPRSGAEVDRYVAEPV